jgi:uncharacterized DUF497 family protein
MEFEWDERKNQENIRRHGIDFAIGARIFDGPVVRKPDDRRDYGELRYIAFGSVEQEILAVVYTVRDTRYRIISTRRANRRERRAYRQVYPEELT